MTTPLRRGRILWLVMLLAGTALTSGGCQPQTPALPLATVEATRPLPTATRRAAPTLVASVEPTHTVMVPSPTAPPPPTPVGAPTRTNTAPPTAVPTSLPASVVPSSTATAPKAPPRAPTMMHTPQPTGPLALITLRIEGLTEEGVACTSLVLYRGEAEVERWAVAALPAQAGARLLTLGRDQGDHLRVLGSPDGRCPWHDGSFVDIDPDRVPLDQGPTTLRFVPRAAAGDGADEDCGPPVPQPTP